MKTAPSQRTSLTLLAALTISSVGSLSLGTASADVQADCSQGLALTCTADVLPGLHCDAGVMTTTCTNATNTDYTVIESCDCPGGEYRSPNYYDDDRSTYVSVEPSTTQSTIFVPANNSANGLQSGCEHFSPTSVHYSVAPPQPAP